jgi:hypothetical protein
MCQEERANFVLLVVLVQGVEYLRYNVLSGRQQRRSRHLKGQLGWHGGYVG